MSCIPIVPDFLADYLSNIHLLEDITGELLQSPNINGSLFRGLEVTSPDAEIRSGTDHSTSQTEGIVREDLPGGSVVILVRN